MSNDPQEDKTEPSQTKYQYYIELSTIDVRKSSARKPFHERNNQEERSSHETSRVFKEEIPEDFNSKWETGSRGIALSVTYFLTTSTILMFGMNFVHRRMPLDVPPLPDLGHELISQLEPENLGDFTMTALIVILIVFVLFFSRSSSITIKFFLMMGNLYVLRVISVLSTSLPPTENHCRYNYQEIENIFLNTLKGIITLGGGNIHCGDLMFSGHTCMATAVWLMLMNNSQSRLIKISATLLLLLTIYFIIGTRSHYTVDIWIALWLTILMYRNTPSAFPFTKKKIQKFIKSYY